MFKKIKYINILYDCQYEQTNLVYDSNKSNLKNCDLRGKIMC